MDLKNKIAIVTGSSKGLGLEIATQLLEQGAIVFGWSRSVTPIEHPNFHGFRLNIGDEKEVTQAFDRVIESQNRIDIVINNAGFGAYDAIEETESEVMRQMFETNVYGTFYLTKCAVPQMKEIKSGHIINIASIAGITGIPNMSVYNATKFAVKGFSESLYKELGSSGIKVTCILPGSIDTHFFDKIDAFSPDRAFMSSKDVTSTILHALQSPASCLPVNIELRPFRLPS